MRTLIVTLLIAGCSPAPKPSEVPNQGQSPVATPPTAENAPTANLPTGNPQSRPPTAARSEKLTADTPQATTAGNPFIAPAGWMISVQGDTTLLAAPEGDSWIAVVDVHAADADAAV